MKICDVSSLSMVHRSFPYMYSTLIYVPLNSLLITVFLCHSKYKLKKLKLKKYFGEFVLFLKFIQFI